MIKTKHTIRIEIGSGDSNGNRTRFNDGDAAVGKTQGGSGSRIEFSPTDKGLGIKNEDGTTGRPSQVGLGHELGHARDGVEGKAVGVDYKDPVSIAKGALIVIDPDSGSTTYMEKDEYRNRKNVDNPIREEQGAKPRAKPKIVP